VRRDGHYVAYARYRDYDGVTRQVERKGKTGAAAERELITALTERAQLHGEDLSPETRLSALADEWLKELDRLGRSAGTVTLYNRQVTHILKGIGSLQLRELTVPAIDRFLQALASSSGPETARLSRVVLSGMCRLAVRRGAMSSNPVRDAGPTPRGKSPVQTVGIDAAVVLRAKLREWDDGRDKRNRLRQTDLADPVDMMLGTGVRTGELFAIRWDDLDIGATIPTVTIHATVVFATGQGYTLQQATKSDTSNRTLKLPPFVVSMLMRRMQTRQSEFVFDSADGTLRSPNNFRTQWRAFRVASGYEDWVVPKTFRKAVATLLADSTDENTARDQLGHSSIAVTRKHYIQRSATGPDARATLELFAGPADTQRIEEETG
jgi:integrase